MKYYSVEVEDHITHQIVVVGSLLTILEARKLQQVLEHFNACYVYVKEYSWFNKKGKMI